MTNNQQDKDDTDRFDVAPNAQTHFAWLRTRLSAERTLMSWVRTAAALISFGFTIVQFFERLKTMEGVTSAVRPEAPRYLGLALIGAGIIGLIIATWEYRWFNRYLWSEQFKPVAGVEDVPWHLPTLGVALVLILIGIFAFGAVLLRFP
jgi:putative membrane protein